MSYGYRLEVDYTHTSLEIVGSDVAALVMSGGFDRDVVVKNSGVIRGGKFQNFIFF